MYIVIPTVLFGGELDKFKLILLKELILPFVIFKVLDDNVITSKFPLSILFPDTSKPPCLTIKELATIKFLRVLTLPELVFIIVDVPDISFQKEP